MPVHIPTTVAGRPVGVVAELPSRRLPPREVSTSTTYSLDSFLNLRELRRLMRFRGAMRLSRRTTVARLTAPAPSGRSRWRVTGFQLRAPPSTLSSRIHLDFLLAPVPGVVGAGRDTDRWV
jgi:hypothetical protein